MTGDTTTAPSTPDLTGEAMVARVVAVLPPIPPDEVAARADLVRQVLAAAAAEVAHEHHVLRLQVQALRQLLTERTAERDQARAEAAERAARTTTGGIPPQVTPVWDNLAATPPPDTATDPRFDRPAVTVHSSRLLDGEARP